MGLQRNVQSDSNKNRSDRIHPQKGTTRASNLNKNRSNRFEEPEIKKTRGRDRAELPQAPTRRPGNNLRMQRKETTGSRRGAGRASRPPCLSMRSSRPVAVPRGNLGIGASTLTVDRESIRTSRTRQQERWRPSMLRSVPRPLGWWVHKCKACRIERNGKWGRKR